VGNVRQHTAGLLQTVLTRFSLMGSVPPCAARRYLVLISKP
jgi:hypothetical protein